MTMTSLLKEAGFETTNEEFIEWSKPSEIEFPFGCCISHMDSEVDSLSLRHTLQGLNYIRKTMKPVTVEEFEKLCPQTKPSPMRNYLLKNIDRVRIINRGTYKRVYNAKPGYQSSDFELENDTPYGFADIPMYFEYSSVTNRIIFRFQVDKIHSIYQNHYLHETKRLTGDNFPYVSNYATGQDYFVDLQSMINDCKVILLYINTWDGCYISHKKYRNEFGFHEECTSPCLGCNIKKHKEYMSGLSGWLSRGGYILDNCFYLICENRRSNADDAGNKYYLTVWNRDYIPNEYTE